MIKEITGDLILQAEEFDVIVHGCNCFHSFGAGIARTIRSTFPGAYVKDKETVYGNKEKLGTIVYTTNTTPIIVNAYTQYKYGNDQRHCDYDAIRSCMKKIKKTFSGKKIGMPKIGAGLAQGDWDIISKIIEQELENEDITVVNWNKEK